MLRLSSDFGKRENVAAVHPVDMLTSTSGKPGLTVRLTGTQKLIRSTGRGTRSVRTRIEHDPQRGGEALDIDALVPGKL